MTRVMGQGREGGREGYHSDWCCGSGGLGPVEAASAAHIHTESGLNTSSQP